ncbi:Gfo/Idh/MocA family oxidoreductase [Sphaerisporangium corydalis]|uniref:Gfo/Idh/MocA family oxidoreductase n=1 Tax=Sphaerisporangium corydalis TaxID=1441875 RepID=A0ABV9EEF5_9ACTN|nr:Gfo/Idh/MocA family oxidoreductase [Sphaerisporangium corydalis]
MPNPLRAAIVGTGQRAQLFTRGLAQREHIDLVALCDPSKTRMAVHNGIITELGRPPAATRHPDEFADLVRDLDIVVVTTVDALHDAYIVPALEAGCRVVTEKPMTTSAEGCRRILAAVDRTGSNLTVAFNYRFNPVHERVRQLLSTGEIGEVLSVHFEWLLDVRHGADYFRRWHRDKASSGGLMVHKSGHHFDLVNWWLGTVPSRVYGQGRLGFYGATGGRRAGHARDYERAYGAPEAADDPFALDLAANDQLRELYLNAEHEDGYLRDRNVFGDGITIEDDMAVLVTYASGATMTYHLTAYAPWEGYRVMFNGTRGRLELEVDETQWAAPRAGVSAATGALHGDVALPNAGGARIRVRPLWSPPQDIPVTVVHEGHGGADERMLAAMFDGTPSPVELADERDGAHALKIGLAANHSFLTGEPVSLS